MWNEILKDVSIHASPECIEEQNKRNGVKNNAKKYKEPLSLIDIREKRNKNKRIIGWCLLGLLPVMALALAFIFFGVEQFLIGLAVFGFFGLTIGGAILIAS